MFGILVWYVYNNIYYPLYINNNHPNLFNIYQLNVINPMNKQIYVIFYQGVYNKIIKNNIIFLIIYVLHL